MDKLSRFGYQEYLFLLLLEKTLNIKALKNEVSNKYIVDQYFIFQGFNI
jgi:hypothetical protein